MNTETGRIYTPDEMRERLSAREMRRDHERRIEKSQAEFEQAYDAGKIVPVSGLVAQQVTLGQRELKRRQKRRAVKDARKKNR